MGQLVDFLKIIGDLKNLNLSFLVMPYKKFGLVLEI